MNDNNQQKINDHVILVSYDITFDAIEIFNRPKEQQAVSIMIYKMLKSNPAEAIKQLPPLIEKYPNDPILAGYLTVAYQCTKNEIMEKQTIIKNYQQFPDYLFARCSYAELCLKENRLSDAAHAINNKFNLKHLYPERSTFHVTEVIFHSSICAKYFCKMGNFDQADIFIDIIEQLDDEHPAIENLTNYYMACFFQKKAKEMNTKLSRPKEKKEKTIKKVTIKNKKTPYKN